MRLRLLLRRLTVSAPRMSVRSTLPWPLRWLSTALLLGFCAALGLWAFDFGKKIAGLDGGRVEYIAQLERQVDDLKRQVERMNAVFTWLGGELGKDGFGYGLGLPELSLLCALDWMDFREVYPTARHDDIFGKLRAAYRDRQSMADTRPAVS